MECSPSVPVCRWSLFEGRRLQSIPLGFSAGHCQAFPGPCPRSGVRAVLGLQLGLLLLCSLLFAATVALMWVASSAEAATFGSLLLAALFVVPGARLTARRLR